MSGIVFSMLASCMDPMVSSNTVLCRHNRAHCFPWYSVFQSPIIDNVELKIASMRELILESIEVGAGANMTLHLPSIHFSEKGHSRAS